MTETVGFELSRQQRCIVAADSEPASSQLATVTLASAWPASLDAATAQHRLAALVATHESFRTTVNHTLGLALPLQHIHDELPVAWIGGANIVAAHHAQQAALDLASGPVLAAGRTDDGALVLTAAAAVADVASLESAAGALAGAHEPEDPVQYAEYAAWQHDRLDEGGADAEHAARTWERLATETTPTVLPDDELAAAEPAADQAEPVSVTGSASVESWLAAWALTIARLVGADAVTLGVELDPRVDPELAGAAGPYSQLVPMTVQIPVEGSFADFAAVVRRDREQAETWFEWAPQPREGGCLFSHGPLRGIAPRTTHQLELRVAADGHGAELRVGSAGCAALAARTARALETVLAGVGGPVADADVLAADDVAALLGPAPQPAGTTPFVSALLASAAAYPERVALTDGTVALPYADLVRRVDRLAAALLEGGASAAAPVAVYLERSVDQIVAILATQRAGAGYLPLDVNQPPARTLQQIQSTGATVLVAHEAPDGYGGTTVAPHATGSATPPEPATEHLAYVIFTSGSTGTPKGVAVDARALANYIAAIADLVGSSDSPRSWAMVTSPTTDLGNTAIFPALATGGTLHVVPTETVQDPVAFAAYAATQAIDVLKITPSHLGALLVDKDAQVLPREVLFVGGEAFPWELADEIRARGACRVVNHYGPTETTVGALAFPMIDGVIRRGRTVPIGRPIPGDEALVLDARRRLVPTGAIGELAIGGAGLARGYVNADAATAERFITHPYRAGERAYLTGDLARRDVDGAITFLGRRDGQVKIRGYRVERGEIEEALRAHPSVRRAAVIVRNDLGSAPQLVGYVVCQVNPMPSERDLHDHLTERLPDYMIPTRILTLESLPLKRNGKLDEEALPLPPAQGGTEVVAPAGAIEQRLAEIFGAVLGIDDVGAEADFFELGGHSLLATRVIVEVRSALGVQLPVYSLFEAPTVRGLAALIAASPGAQVELSNDELAAMIAELDELTDEEAAALLAADESRVADSADPS